MPTDDGRRPRIMIVDDDESIHVALRFALEDEFETIAASSGEAALRQLTRGRVDLILLDLLMPGTDGWQIFEQVQQMNGHRPRIVFLTAVDSSTAAVAAIKLGADDWILKPFEELALRTRLRLLLSHVRRVWVRGGDLGARATIATVAFVRCGRSALYAPNRVAPGSDEPVIEAAEATTPQGLASVLGRPPISLAALHRTTTAAIHYVGRHYRDLEVASLASEVGVSPNCLLERFRSDLRLTTREYIARVRIEVIKQRLREPDCPSLDRLAEDVGLYDAAHVHKTFARYLQGLPSAYRGNVQDDQ